MATTMTASDRVSFSCPVISPKHYIVKGPSGWVETFARAKLDAELKAFVFPVAPHELAELFVAQRELSLNKEPPTWFTITNYLARTKSISPHSIPATVGVAFWAAIEIAKRERVERGN